MRIQLVGAGSIGGSIALRLSKAGHELSVFDKNRDTNDMLRKRGVDFEVCSGLCEGVDLTVLAIPMSSEAELLNSASIGGPVVDVASVMQPFQTIANRRKIRFVSGHPMAGNENVGPEGWNEFMFDGRTFMLWPGECATKQDVDLVLEIVADLGSIPEFLSPEKHDYIVSRVSQAVYFLSGAVLKLGKDVEKYSGPGYDSTSRLGRQNMDMVLDMARFNGPNIASSLEEAERYLCSIRIAIEKGDLDRLRKTISIR